MQDFSGATLAARGAGERVGGGGRGWRRAAARGAPRRTLCLGQVPCAMSCTCYRVACSICGLSARAPALGAVGGAYGQRLARFAPRSGRWRTPVDLKPRPGAARHVLYVFPPRMQHVLQGRSSKNTRCKWCRTRNSWLPRPCQRSAGLCSRPRRVDCRSRRLHTTSAS